MGGVRGGGVRGWGTWGGVGMKPWTQANRVKRQAKHGSVGCGVPRRASVCVMPHGAVAAMVFSGRGEDLVALRDGSWLGKPVDEPVFGAGTCRTPAPRSLRRSSGRPTTQARPPSSRAGRAPASTGSSWPQTLTSRHTRCVLIHAAFGLSLAKCQVCCGGMGGGRVGGQGGGSLVARVDLHCSTPMERCHGSATSA